MQRTVQELIDSRLVAVVALATLVMAGSALAGGHGKSQGGGHGESKDPHAAATSAPIDEPVAGGVVLGEFQVRSYYPVEAQKSTVRFVLFGSVPDEKLDAMRAFVKDHRNRIRDQVITATRLAPLALYDEGDLASFRRRIIVRLRRMLPELEVDDVYVSDFTLVVKSL